MKTIMRILAVALFGIVIPTAVVMTGISVVTAGCHAPLDPAGPYAGNTALYTTDSAITAAFGVLDVFMTFQMQNRASLPAEVNDFADRTRRDAPGWSKSILALRDVYAANPTPANKLELDKVVRLLREAVAQATLYIAPTASKP